jgi:hypothetical protein
MAYQAQWTCDGCDDRQLTSSDKTRPPDWAGVHVEINGIHRSVGRECEAVHYDLCLRCQRRLAEAADPKRWTRVGPAERAP